MKDTFRHKGLRKILVDNLREKGIRNEKVLEMINQIPRHQFLDNAFIGNIATSCGGAFQADNDYHTVTLLRNRMEKNQAPNGAGICTYNYVDLIVQNTLFFVHDIYAATYRG